MCVKTSLFLVALFIVLFGCGKEPTAAPPVPASGGSAPQVAPKQPDISPVADHSAPVAPPSPEPGHRPPQENGERLTLPFPTPEKAGTWPEVFAYVATDDLNGTLDGTRGMIDRIRKDWGLTKLWVLMNADGSNMRPLPEFYNKLSYFWLSPDRTKVAYLDPKPSTEAVARRGKWCPPLLVADNNGLNPVKIHDGFDSPSYDLWPALEWTQDSKCVVFQAYNRDNWDIFIVNADGTNKVQITKSEFDDVGPRISPSGSVVAFFSSRLGTNVNLLRNRERNQDESVANSDPAKGPSSCALFVAGTDGNGEPSVIGEALLPGKDDYKDTVNWPSVAWLGGNKISFLVRQVNVVESKNGRHVERTATIHYGVKIADVTTKESVLLTFAAQKPLERYNPDPLRTAKVQWCIWSPDCKKLAFATDESDGVDIFIGDVPWAGTMPAAGSVIAGRNLTESEKSPYKSNTGPRFSPDGRFFFYSAQKDAIAWTTAIDLMSFERQRLRDATDTMSYFWREATVLTPPAAKAVSKVAAPEVPPIVKPTPEARPASQSDVAKAADRAAQPSEQPAAIPSAAPGKAVSAERPAAEHEKKPESSPAAVPTPVLPKSPPPPLVVLPTKTTLSGSIVGILGERTGRTVTIAVKERVGDIMRGTIDIDRLGEATIEGTVTGAASSAVAWKTVKRLTLTIDEGISYNGSFDGTTLKGTWFNAKTGKSGDFTMTAGSPSTR